MKTILVLTSGGDAPGMNTAIRAIAKVGAARGARVMGVLAGYDGLMAGTFRELSRAEDGTALVDAEVDMMGGLGGTVLGSARSARFRTPEGRAEAAKQVAGMDGLIVIGGNGSLTGAHMLAAEHGVRVIGMPASIDNDIGCTGMAIGVDTALNTIVDACDRISDTARAHRRAFVVEVMGRESGYLAMAAGVAAGADAVLFREQGRSEVDVIDRVEQVIRAAFAPPRNKRRVLVIKSEGIQIPCTRMVRILQERIEDDLEGVDVRATVLGHLVRGGSPSFQDRMIGDRLSFAAVTALLEGRTDEMVAWQPPLPGGTATLDPSVRLFTLEHVLTETQALHDGTSPVIRARLALMENAEGVLGL